MRLAGEAGPVASALATRRHGDCHVPRRVACGVPVLHSLDASSTSSGATTKNARRMWLNVPPPDTSHSVGKRAGPGGGSRTQGSQAWRAAAGAPAGEAWAPSRLPLALLCGEQDEGSGERRGPGVFWTHFGGRCSTTRVCVRERDKGGPVD